MPYPTLVPDSCPDSSVTVEHVVAVGVDLVSRVGVVVAGPEP